MEVAMAILDCLIRFVSAIPPFLIEFGKAWNLPLVAAIAAWTVWRFKDVVISFIGKVDRVTFRGMGMSVEFEKMKEFVASFASFEDRVAEGSTTTDITSRTKSSLERDVLDLVLSSPRKSIHQSWYKLNASIVRLAIHLGREGQITLTSDVEPSILDAVPALEEKDIMPSGLHDQIRVYKDLLVYGPDDPRVESFALAFAIVAKDADAIVNSIIGNSEAQGE